MTSRGRRLDAGRRVILAVCCVLVGILSGAPALAAEGIAIVPAPAGETLAAAEADYLETLAAELADQGLPATVLHAESPLLQAAEMKLPGVSAEDDWSPLGSVLDRIATQLRLDYVLLTSIGDADGATRSVGLLVARGGASEHLSAADAPTMAAGVSEALAALGPPQDEPDEFMEIGAEALRPGIEDERPQIPEPTEPADTAHPDDPPEIAEPAPDDEPLLTPVPDEERPVDTDETEEAPRRPLAVMEEPERPEAEISEEPERPDPALPPAEEAYQKGELDVAASLLDDYLATHEPSGRAHLLRAKLNIARLEHDAAMGQLERAVRRDPELVEARVWLGRLHAERGLWQQAIEHYERALELDATHLEGLLGLARVYRDHGHRRRAIRLLQEADEAGQNDPALLLMLGNLLVGDGNTELAARQFLRAATHSSGERRGTALERLGDLYVELGRHRDALGCYLEAAQLNPSRASMAKRRYREVMAAADGSVDEALTSGWRVFEQFVENRKGQRETVYAHLQELHDQLDEALQFSDGITPPGELREDHTRRQLAYSLALEATVNALSFLDLGEKSMLSRAASRHEEALEEFRRLQRAHER